MATALSSGRLFQFHLVRLKGQGGAGQGGDGTFQFHLVRLKA